LIRVLWMAVVPISRSSVSSSAGRPRSSRRFSDTAGSGKRVPRGDPRRPKRGRWAGIAGRRLRRGVRCRRQNATGGLDVGFCRSRARIRLSSPFWSAAMQRFLPRASSQGYHVENLYSHLALIADCLAETPLPSDHLGGSKKQFRVNNPEKSNSIAVGDAGPQLTLAAKRREEV
jgi:hypothetical protein